MTSKLLRPGEQLPLHRLITSRAKAERKLTPTFRRSDPPNAEERLLPLNRPELRLSPADQGTVRRTARGDPSWKPRIDPGQVTDSARRARTVLLGRSVLARPIDRYRRHFAVIL